MLYASGPMYEPARSCLLWIRSNHLELNLVSRSCFLLFLFLFCYWLLEYVSKQKWKLVFSRTGAAMLYLRPILKIFGNPKIKKMQKR